MLLLRARHDLQAAAAALLFLDRALERVAAAGGTCFDSSRWGSGLNISVSALLSSHASALHSVTVSARPPLETVDPAIVVALPVCLPVVTSWPAAATAAHLAGKRVLVHCLVPLVWPEQKPFMEAIGRTYGPDCDEVKFFVALADDVSMEVPEGGSSIVDLHAV